MRIGIDIDDTITDTFEYLQPHLAAYLGVSVRELEERNLSYNNYPWKNREELLQFARATFSRLIENAPGKEGAAESIRKLRHLGHEIIIVTGRSDEFYEDCVRTTQNELRNLGVEYDALICTMDKGNAAREWELDVMVDDDMRNLDKATAFGTRGILFRSEANQGKNTEYPEVSNWDTLRNLLMSME